MKCWSDDIRDGKEIPSRLAFGQYDDTASMAFAANRSPHLAWSEVPEGTRSFALVCVDQTAPTKPDDVNQEGRVVPAELPRGEFFHWVVVDIDASTRELAEGLFGEGVVPQGKEGPGGPLNTRVGLNDYTGWFTGDSDMEGQYFGYDGPCPPWNDSLVHHYVFRLFALDVDQVDVKGAFSGAEMRRAIEGHVLAETSFVGTYKINPDAQ